MKAEFLTHAGEEQTHADQLAARIVQLGGEPNLSPAGLTEQVIAKYVEGDDLEEMIKEDLVAERIAIESYRDMIAFVGTTIRRPGAYWKRSSPRKRNMLRI